MRIHVWTFNLVLLISAATSLLGQQGTSTVTGTVVDPAAAVVPNATVKLTNTDLGAARDAQTSATGEFRFDAVIPGDYKLEVSSTGFKNLVIDHIAVLSSEIRGLGNLTMQLGTASESVTVSAAVTPVQTASSEQSQTISSDQLNENTFRGRDPYSTMHLLPGIVDTSLDGRQQPNNTAQGGISVNGMTANNTQAVLDGAPVDHMACNSCFNFVVPNMDAISEVRVLQTGIQAEFGRISGGGTINFITKSGTSQFHGSAHWDHRNEDMNANSFFNNRSDIQRNVYRYLILGGSIGGPVYIPKVIPKYFKDRIFFFYSPEYSSSKQPTTVTTVHEPTSLELAGNFSQTYYASAAAPTVPILQVITDPNNAGKPFPGNIIPANRFDPTGTGQGLLSLLLPANGYVAPATPYAYNSIYYQTPTYSRMDQVARIDATLTDKINLYWRIAHDTPNLEVVNGGSQAQGGCYHQDNPGGSEAYHVADILTPRTVLEVQFTRGNTYGAFPNFCGNTPLDADNRTASLNPPRLNALPAPNSEFNGFVPHWGYPLYPPKLPLASFAGGNYPNYASYTSNPTVPYIAGDNQWTLREDLSHVWGPHALKFGYYFEHSSDFDEPGGTWEGSYNFGSTTANPLDTGDGYANALLGIFQSYTETTIRSIQRRHLTADEWYLQDSWKVTSRLTLDYGVRFLHNSPSWDDSHFSTRFVPSMYSLASAPRLYYPACKVAGPTCSTTNQEAIDPVTGQTAIANFAGNLVPGSGNYTDGVLYPNPTGGISYQAVGVQPRFGFAYNVGGAGKFVIRGSGGIFQSRPNLNNIISAQQDAAPIAFTPVVYYNTTTGLEQSANTGTVIPPVTEGVGPKQKLEGIYQYNLTVEREMGSNIVATVTYVGNYDRHALLNETQNNVPLGAYALPQNVFSNTEINPNLLRNQYPGLGLITVGTMSESAVNYQGLQTSLKRRFSHGFYFGAAYTFSKSLGTIGWDPYHIGMPITTAYGATVTLPGQRQWYYGPTTQDRTQWGSFNWAYELPGPKSWGIVGKVALNGWTLSGVTSVSSGAPITPSCTSTAAYPTSDPTWSGAAASAIRCEAVGNWKNYTQSFYTNFNTSAFAFPNGGTAAAPIINFGNTGIGILRGPGWWNQDVTLAKAFQLGAKEARRLIMSLQAYNVFNHTEFNAIGSTYSFNAAGVNTNATTGQYTATNQPREMVVTARFQF